MIKFSEISLIRENRVILDSVQFHMKKGENWVILGRNGSGKSTILEMMNGYLFPSKGTIEVMGNHYGRCDVREVRKKIGYISQSLVEKLTLRDPVWEVVAAGEYGYLRFYEHVPEELKQRAEEMLSIVKIDRLKDQPLGLLSQGERKKVLLARALMTNPSLLIMDEPCAGLDLYERELLLSDLEKFQQRGIQMIYVTHHIEEIVPVFTHVMLVHEGKILAAGPKKEILTPTFIEQAYDTPVDVDWHGDRPWIKVR